MIWKKHLRQLLKNTKQYSKNKVMKYDGKELIEMTPEKWDGKSRRMLIWDDGSSSPYKKIVVGYNPANNYWMTDDGWCWQHCAEFPKEKPNQEQNVDEMIKVLNAYKAGKKIEYRIKDKRVFHPWTYSLNPPWDWAMYEYRVEQEPRRMTNKELKEWLKKNCGQYFMPSPNSFINGYVRTQFGYGIGKDDELVKEGIQIRAWYESEWHEPIVEE